MSGELVVETIDLTKVYNGITAVNKLNLRIEEGDIFGFLGPNGAGKTTAILMLLGLTEPTSGVARVCGYNSTREPIKVKRIAGYSPERVGFYDDLSATYNLLYTIRLNGLSDAEAKERIGRALEIVGLSERADSKVATYSRGMKQRLALAELLVKQPRVAILDEPTSGIDPKGILEILDLISRIAREERMSIVISSHQLPQVQRICNRIGIMSRGQLVAEGLVSEMARETIGSGHCQVEVQLTEITSLIVDAIKQTDGVVAVSRVEDQLIVTCAEDVIPRIAKAVVDANGLLRQMKVQSFGLEDIYMKYFREG